MRVIRTEFSSLHLCSLTFSRPLRTLFSFCLQPVLDERLMTSIRGLRLLTRVWISMNSHLEVIFIYIKFFFLRNDFISSTKGALSLDMRSNDFESSWFISADSPQTHAWKWLGGFPAFSCMRLPLAGISRAPGPNSSPTQRCAVALRLCWLRLTRPADVRACIPPRSAERVKSEQEWIWCSCWHISDVKNEIKHQLGAWYLRNNTYNTSAKMDDYIWSWKELCSIKVCFKHVRDARQICWSSNRDIQV